MREEDEQAVELVLHRVVRRREQHRVEDQQAARDLDEPVVNDEVEDGEPGRVEELELDGLVGQPLVQAGRERVAAGGAAVPALQREGC